MMQIIEVPFLFEFYHILILTRARLPFHLCASKKDLLRLLNFVKKELCSYRKEEFILP